MSEKKGTEETEKKEKKIDFADFKVILGVVIAAGSFFFTADKYFKEQANISVNVNYIDVVFKNTTYNNQLLGSFYNQLDYLEEKYSDITEFWLIDVLDIIETYDSTDSKSSLSLVELTKKYDEAINYFDEKLPISSEDLILDWYDDSDFEVYLDYDSELYVDAYMLYEYQALKSGTYLDEDASYYSESMKRIESMSALSQDSIMSLAQEYFTSNLTDLVDKLSYNFYNIESLFYSEETDFKVELVVENKSRNTNVIQAETYLFISDKFDDKSIDSSLFVAELEFNDHLKLEPYSIREITISLDGVSGIIESYKESKSSADDNNNDDLDYFTEQSYDYDSYLPNTDSDVSLILNKKTAIFVDFFTMKRSKDLDQNFILVLRDVQDNYWTNEGIIQEINQSRDEIQFLEKGLNAPKTMIGRILK